MESGQDCADFGVIFTKGKTEHRHHLVSCVLVDVASVGDDDVFHGPEVFAYQESDGARFIFRHELRVSPDIAAKDRGLFPHIRSRFTSGAPESFQKGRIEADRSSQIKAENRLPVCEMNGKHGAERDEYRRVVQPEIDLIDDNALTDEDEDREQEDDKGFHRPAPYLKRGGKHGNEK